MNQAEQAAIISIMVFCGVVAVAHILAALYLLHRAEKKAESQQPKQGQDIPAKPEPLPNPVSVKDAKERKKRQKIYL